MYRLEVPPIATMSDKYSDVVNHQHGHCIVGSVMVVINHGLVPIGLGTEERRGCGPWHTWVEKGAAALMKVMAATKIDVIDWPDSHVARSES